MRHQKQQRLWISLGWMSKTEGPHTEKPSEYSKRNYVSVTELQ